MNIQSVPAGRGWQWIVAAFSLFKKNPLIWVVLHLILILIGAGLSHPAGDRSPICCYLLTPLLLGGLMSAAKDIESGQDIEIAHLFRGFRQNNTLHLITVGGVYLVGQVVISGVMIMLGGPEFQQARRRSGVEGHRPRQHSAGGRDPHPDGAAGRDGTLGAADHGDVVFSGAGGSRQPVPVSPRWAKACAPACATCCPSWSTA